MKRLVLAVDFDGVLVQNGQDMPGSASWLKATARRHKVIIHTCRAGWPEGKATVEAWLASHGLKLEVTNVKPVADMYLDDHAVRFTGTYPTRTEIKSYARTAHS